MGWYSWVPMLLAQAGEAVAKTDESQMSPGMKLLVAIGILVGSFAIGHFIAQGLRLPEFSVRIGFVLFTLVAGIAICVLGWPPKLGIDLSGGVVLVYEVDRNQSQSQGLEQAVSLVNKSLSGLKGQKPTARINNTTHQLEIVLPNKSEEAEVKTLLGKLDSTDFTLKPAGHKTEGDKPVLAYDVEQQSKSIDMSKLIAAINRRINPGGVLELTVRQYGAEQIEVIIPEVDPRQIDQIKKKISTSGLLEFRILANQATDQHVILLARQTPGRDVYEGGRVVARWVKLGRQEAARPGDETRKSPSRGTEILVLKDALDITGSYLTSATTGVDERGNFAVHFKLDSTGGSRFGRLTGNNLPNPATGLERQLAIVLDDEVLSAPSIKSTINNDGQITGNFSEEEVNFLVGVLNAGSLPAALSPEPIRQQEISAQLGDDTIKQGSNAMIASTLAVLAFMLFYYRFAGIVADVAVVMNMILAVALMIMIKAAFTLPGLAGLVLTVGMAVDANVLIYERMREEAARGASFRMTIRNGFTRAMSTIIDSNTTTVISAVVLYIVGTDQVKGFAVTLILGLVVSLYTAIYVARLIFDIVERKRWVTQLHMRLLIGETNIDFVRWLTPAITASCIVIGIGLAAAVVRGKGLLDIDFSGGSSVQFKFDADKPHDAQEIREKLGDLPDLAVSAVGNGVEARKLEFQIDTSEPDVIKVQDTLKKVFGEDLATYSLKFGDVEPFNPAEKTAAKTDEKSATNETMPKPPAQAPAQPVEKPAQPAATTPAATPPAQPAATPPAQPAEKPAAATPPAEKPSAAQPGPEKPTSETPATEKPEAEKPATGTPDAESSTKPTGKTASVTRPRFFRRAAFAALLAAAFLAPDEPAKAAPSDAADAAKTAVPASEPAKAAPASDAAQPATAAKPSTESEPAKPEDNKQEPAKPDVAKPQAAAPDATAPTASATGPTASATGPAASATGPAASATAPAASVPAQVGSRVKLTFAEPITYDALRPMIEHWLSQHELASTQFELLNPSYKPGSASAYAAWTLEIMLPADKTEALLKDIQNTLNDTPVFPSSNSIGGKVAGDTQMLAIYALLASMAMIVIYVWIRFQNVMFGLAAVLATFHDVIVAIGFLALSKWLAPYFGWAMVDDFKISLAVVAALLTIVGYSINDTIVIFDRIREIRGKNPDLTAKMINLAVNQCMGRTILTSGTVLIGTAILYFFGGQGIHPFAYAMLVGLISGTYSTVYIASPMLLLLRRADETRGDAKPAPALAGGKGRS